MRVCLAPLALTTLVLLPQAVAAQPVVQPVVPLDSGAVAHARLLVISPHPDDGTLGGGGLIARVIARGGAVRIVQVTSGDAFANGVKAEVHTDAPTADDYRRYGALREHEAADAIRHLGVGRRSLTFLGFPDDGLCRLASDYRSAATAFESPYTRRVSPPFGEQIAANVAYRGADTERELARIMAAFRPTLVLMPDPHDEHPDHCSTHLLAHNALEAAASATPGLAPRVLHYLIHYGTWPTRASDASAASLTPPRRLLVVGAAWRTLALTPRELARKQAALVAYHSQMIAIGQTIESFERDNELFTEGDPGDVAACWCRGINVAVGPWSHPARAAPARQ